MFWTEKQINEMKAILGSSASITEACFKWNQKKTHKVSTASLRRVFYRYVGSPPSSFLADVPVDDFGEDGIPPVDDIEDEIDDDDEYDSANFLSDENVIYSSDGKSVIVYTPKRLFKFSVEMYEGMHFDYSNMAPGGSSTINEICKKYKLRRKHFIAVKTAAGWTHDNDPYTEQVHSKRDTGELVADLIQKKRAEFEKRFTRSENETMKKDAESWRRTKFIFGGDFCPDKVNNKIESLFTLKNFCANYENLGVIKEFSAKRATGKVGLIIPVSDLHAGKLYKSTNPNFKNIDKEVLRRRKDMICHYIRKESLKNKYDFIRYMSLGDDFESLFGNMRKGQHLTMDMHTTAQYRFVLDFHLDIINTIVDSFPDTDIVATFQGGNHDRVFEEREWGSENLIVAMMVDRIMQDFRDNDRVKFVVGSPVFSQMCPNGLNIISQHGHTSRVLEEKDVNNFIMVHGNKQEASRTLVLQGHFHKFVFRTGNKSHYMVNGSICGNDNFNTENLNLVSFPEFTMVKTTEQSEYVIGPFNLEFEEVDDV
jgi:predicted phosphodiesterase